MITSQHRRPAQVSHKWTYECDSADRLTKVSSNGVVMLENWYDASSRRIARSERIGGSMVGYLSLYDGWDIVALVNTSGAIHESYTRGVSIAGDIGLGASTVGVGVIAVASGVGVIGYAHFELVHDLNSLRHDFDDCVRRCRERETK